MLLEARGITKKYGDLAVLKGIDLDIDSGEIVSIVGSSGAGKTTLLQILGTLDSADSGIVRIAGKDITKLSSNEIAKFRNTELGFVFQFHQLLPEFSALENAIMPALIKGTNSKIAEKEALRIFEMLGIEARLKHLPTELSGGEQQRVAVARALINNPKIIFADEPSGNLDSSSAQSLHELFFSLRKELNQTFIIVTHNTELANMADRKIVMQDGNCI